MEYTNYIIKDAIFTGHTHIIILGVSGAIILPFVRLISDKRLIVNLDGIESRRGKWGKYAKWYLKLSEKFACKYAHIVISDNAEIQKYIRSEYFVESEMIPYGGDHTLLSKGKATPFKELNLPEKYYYSLCRIEPENNPDIILSAFSNTSENLVFIGNWFNSTYGRALFEAYSSFDNLTLLHPIYDLSKLTTIRSSAFGYVHGHSAGGTNPSLVEAIFHNSKILCYDCSFNRSTMEQTGFYFTDVTSLNSLLNTKIQPSYNSHFELRKKYSWSKISLSYWNLLEV